MKEERQAQFLSFDFFKKYNVMIYIKKFLKKLKKEPKRRD